MWILLIVFGYLCLLSFYDLKYRSVPHLALMGGSVTAFIIAGGNLLFTGKDWWDIAAGLIPGGFILIIAYLTGKIGYGDGWLLLIVGLVLGYRSSIILFLSSLFLISAMSITLILVKKAKKEMELPYIPFLAAATLVNIMFHG